jgi:hypothetical protein
MKALVIALIVALQIPLARSRPLIREFARQTGYPNGRPGYVVDHQIPLCAGGPDTIANLQWQEKRASYVKDQFERELCRDMKRLNLMMVNAPKQ